ncbi:polyunsaturated fatty acid 5-lipoxygenase-like isoform X1 [Anguilla anguilla]|uniref:polyunsaturated fatty acid 5-lipoxygenase-like isoform X1 n=1 Tax=Anguilla anguilla TaxID=7936 RepID=UPI0015ABED79|nr:polyunsaturated fatty acid 5-lipoxygenase-like isoform X1 [Anguilla anguilla]
MHCYTVTVATGNDLFSGTDACIYLTLVGTERCSEKTLLNKFFRNDFERGAVDGFDIEVAEDLGEIELVKIENRKYIVKNDWYCRYIKVKTPSGETLEFPCYRWVVNDQEVVLRDGRARLPQDDKTSLLKEHRRKELETRKTTYRWREWQPGFPMSIDANAYKELPLDIQFDSKKGMDFTINYVKAIQNLGLNKFMEKFQSSWDDFDDFKKIFVKMSNTASEYLMQHWKEDFVFAYQFLNGCNPVMIRKCTKLPAKFPVTHEMVEFCLERHLTLEEEIKAGNIYIVDYEIMENITPNRTDPSTSQYLAAPICLLYKNTKNKIQPIAIQLGQNPGENSPIFLPNDEDCDWTLAKMWVRSSDFSVHQTVTHLLRTHLISEVFGIALFRQLPAVHPVYKLIIPHIRFTIAINTKGRDELIGKNSLFDKANVVGGGGHVELVQKAMKTFTYQSLVFPEAIKASGMEDLPDYFYRDDGNKVWEAIKSFVEDIVHIYYKSDNVVQEDEEIQAFVKDVCMFGMQNGDNSGFPKSLKNREQLIEYLTIIIFTASAQHAAVNFGQFHWNSWIPNCPSTMRKPPPTKKGVATTAYIIESLPDRGRTCWHLGASWALSRFQDNELFLGMYTDKHFVEMPVKEAMEKYRKKLAEVVRLIQARNKGKNLPYCLLSPDRIPNSVAV